MPDDASVCPSVVLALASPVITVLLPETTEGVEQPAELPNALSMETATGVPTFDLVVVTQFWMSLVDEPLPPKF